MIRKLAISQAVLKTLRRVNVRSEPCKILQPIEVNVPARCFSLKRGVFYNGTIETCLNSAALSTGDWTAITNKLVESERDITPLNVEALLLEYFVQNNLYVEAEKFETYLLNSQKALNLGTLGKLLKFHHLCANNGIASDKDERRIFQLYDYLQTKYKILDSTTNQKLIFALSVTSEWKKCLKILETIKENDNPTTSVYSCIASAAFRRGEIEIGWSLLREAVEANRTPLQNVYSSWIDHVAKSDGSIDEKISLMERMFNYCADNDYYMQSEVAQKLFQFFQNDLGWAAKLVKINPGGKCPNCRKVLNNLTVSSEECELLRKEFYERVVVDKNVFAKSSPMEVEAFVGFLDKYGPFDIVVDGLNAGRSTSSSAPVVQLKILNNIVKNFLEVGHKILVLGRKHMNTWPKEHLKYLKSNAHMFFVENTSFDDIFLIYASLSSPETYFVSRDLMRSHKSLLSDERMKTIFKRWQQTHQYMVDYVDKTGRVFIKDPIKFSIVPNKNVGWHIPYDSEVKSVRSDSYEFPNYWLCAQPPPKKFIRNTNINRMSLS